MKVMQSGRQTARRLIIFRRTCTPAIIFWAYSYAGSWNFGLFGQIFWRITRPYARWRKPCQWRRIVFRQRMAVHRICQGQTEKGRTRLGVSWDWRRLKPIAAPHASRIVVRSTTDDRIECIQARKTLFEHSVHGCFSVSLDDRQPFINSLLVSLTARSRRSLMSHYLYQSVLKRRV